MKKIIHLASMAQDFSTLLIKLGLDSHSIGLEGLKNAILNALTFVITTIATVGQTQNWTHKFR